MSTSTTLLASREMEGSKKRKSPPAQDASSSKKPKKQWRTPKKGQYATISAFEPGDAGIWATCAMGKEGKSTADLRDLFEDYASKIYGDILPTSQQPSTNAVEHNDDDDNGNGNNDEDIEASISAEVKDMKSASTHSQNLFQAVKIDVQCVLFFKTRSPVEPVEFVHRICRDAAEGKAKSRCRFVKRLTPMSRMGKATVAGLEEVCGRVLAPVFGAAGEERKKFAIRPTIRNNNTMKRDDVIKQIATAVGAGHVVDLTSPDVVILVDIYRNMLGMSVVGDDYETLKRFNLAEIYEPTPKPDAAKNGEDSQIKPAPTSTAAQE